MAFGHDFDASDDVMSEINMTPLVDVMLVLLIIFIITVPVLTHHVPVDLPQATNVPQQPQPTAIQLSVDAKGQIFWQDQAVSKDELRTRLTAAAAQQPQPDVHLRGDRSVAYEHVIETMAIIQTAGLTKLGFVTEPSSSSAAP